MYLLVSELAADGIPVVVSCLVLKLARAAYYRWLDEPFTDGQLDEAWLANAIFDAHRDDPEFGYRFLADEVRLADHVVSDRVVWRICWDHAWWSRFGKPEARKGSKPGTPAHDDLVRRDFTARAPNELWLSDLTEHWTREGKLYVCAIKDVYSNRGRLGQKNTSQPFTLRDTRGVQKVAVGGGFACGLLVEGRVECWGLGPKGLARADSIKVGPN